jgi:beta-glucanase (GH16 family)
LEILPRHALPILAICVALLAALVLPAQASAAWSLRFSGQFSHGINTSVWTEYHGQPRCCKNTLWSRSHIKVKSGILRLQNFRDAAYGGRWVSAGISMGRSLNQTYGRWHVRFRMTKGRGVGMCIFLWPAHGWPPEVDFAEESSDVGGRSYETGTLHYGSSNHEIHSRVHANFQNWHTVGVTWLPGLLRYTLDGHTWGQVTGSRVPNVPMHLGIQTHVGSNGQSGGMPDVTTPSKVALQVDFVKVWRWS